MRKTICSFIIIYFVIIGLCSAQSVTTLTFTGKSSITQEHIPLHHVLVNNVSQHWEEVLYYPDTILQMGATGVEEYDAKSSVSLLQNIPNPFDGVTDFALELDMATQVIIEVYDINGQRIMDFSGSLGQGNHLFRATLSSPQTYIVSAQTMGNRLSIKMVNSGNGKENSLVYLGCSQLKGDIMLNLKNGRHLSVLPFSIGDMMDYRGYVFIHSTEYSSSRVQQAQWGNEEIELSFNLSRPIVQTVPINNIGGENASSGGMITNDGNLQIEQRGVCWSTTQNPSIADSHTNDGVGMGSFSSQLQNLTLGTTYYVRAYATNGLGTSYGNQVGFRTLAFPTITTLDVTGISSSAAICGGNISSDGDSPITARGVCWATSQNPTLADSYTSDGDGIGTFSSQIQNLTMGTTYYVRAYATNSVGTAYGNERTFTTHDIPTVLTGDVADVTESTVRCGGEVTSDGGTAITSRGVCWSTSQNPTIADNHTADGNGTGSFSSLLSGLSAGTTYYIRAYATNSVGTAYGAQVTVTTLDLPVVVTNNLSGLTSTTVVSGGNVTSDGGSIVTARGVCWSMSPNPTLADNHTTDGEGIGLFTSQVQNLTWGTTYFIRAYATNSVGTAYGDQLSFTTHDIPTVTTNSINDITAYTASVFGTVESDGGETVTARGICWGIQPNPTLSDNTISSGTGIGNFSVLIQGLAMASTYYVRAYATNGVGTNYGQCLSLTTLCDTLYSSFSAASCRNYIWNGHSYNESGSFDQTLTASNGCDSIVTLNLTISQPVNISIRQVACSSFTWNNQVYTQSGTYTQTFTAANGCDSTVTMTLYIPTPPTVTITGNHYVCENSMTALNAWVNGVQTDNAVSQCRWFRDGEFVASGYFCESQVNVNGGFAYNFSVEIIDTNNCSFTSTPFEVNVIEKPEVYITASATTVTAGTTVNFNASLDNPYLEQLRYRWYKNNYSPEGRIIGATSSSYSSVIDTTSVYIIEVFSNLIPSDSLCYATASLTIIVPVRAAVATIGVESIYTTSAIGNGRIINDGNSPIASYGICWSTQPNPTITDFRTTVSGSLIGDFANLISPLLPNRTYYFRAYAINGEGTAYGECLSFTTLCDTTYVDIQNTSCVQYTWNDQTYTESGDYIQNFTAVHGCDSVVTLHLTINQPVATTFSDTACVQYTWNGQTYTETGVYVQTFTAANNCDSVVTLRLTINQPVATEFSDTACVQYTWNDQTYTESGEYVQTFTAANNCDSVVTLHLTINQPAATTFSDTACVQYTWNDQTYTESGEYVQTFTAANNCDSVVTLHLTINQPVATTFSETSCVQYTWNDQTYTESGEYVQIFTAANHCDSVVTLRLTINQPVATSFSDTACVQYTWNDLTYTESGEYVQTLTAANNCDSVVTASLTIFPNTSQTLSVIIIENELPYILNGISYYETGTYQQHLTNTVGCDSLITLNFAVMNNVTTAVDSSICDNELPFTWNDVIFTEAGVRSATLTASNMADSVVIMNLTVYPTEQENTSFTICQNELPYTWRDTTFQNGTLSGDYVFHRHSIHGCDSIVTLSLTVYPKFEQEENLAICQNELPYIWRDTTFQNGTFSGDYVFHRHSIHGCDSIVTLNLTVYPKYEQEESLFLCQNELPYTWRDTTFQVGTIGGIFVFHRQTIHGCDSVVSLNLTVYPKYEQEEDLTICQNELPYAWRDTTFQNGTLSGDYVFHRHSIHGCDSIVTLSLTVYPKFEQEENLAICQNELPYIWRDTTFQNGTFSGDYVFHRHSIHGCDSIVTLNLTVYPKYEQEESLFLCQNELPYTWRDTAFQVGTIGGIFIFHRRTIHGCDSTVTLNLTVYPKFEQEENLAICQNELPYVWRDTTFQVGTSSGGFIFHKQSIHGCDSTVMLNLTVYPKFEQEENLAICQNELPYIWRDTTFQNGTLSGNYVFHRHSIHGCDSIVTLNLKVYPEFEQEENLFICPNDLPYTWRDTTFQVGSNSSDYLFHRQTIHGCDSIVTLNLTVYPKFEQEENLAVCQNDLPYTWRDTTFQVGTSSGDYVFHRQTIHGCDSTVILNLTVHPKFEQEENLAVCQNDLPYTWRDTTFQTGTISGNYVFHRRTIHGCDSVVTLNLTVYPKYELEESMAICNTELPYTWRDTTFQVGTISGDYILHRHTNLGCDSIVTLHFLIQAEPLLPQIDTSFVGNITSNSAEINVSIIEDICQLSVSRGVCWATHPMPTMDDETISSEMTLGDFVCNIVGLQEGTTYYVRAYAVNGAGVAYGEQMSFTTLPVDGAPCLYSHTLTDSDGNTYNTVKIGEQCWMKENLRTTKYADGTTISQGSSTSTTTAYWYYPNDNSSNKSIYGLLYNWKAVMRNASSSTSNPSGVQGICPIGWHVPSDAEWTQLTIYVSSQNQYLCNDNATYIAKALASNTADWHWGGGNTCAIGTALSDNNSTEFSALPAGLPASLNGGYSTFGSNTNFWSSTQNNSNTAYIRNLSADRATIYRGDYDKYYGMSIRCVRNDGVENTIDLPNVITNDIINITHTTATGGGNITDDGGATIIGRGMCWSNYPNPTIADSHTTDGAGTGMFTSSITGLTANTTYYVRAYATNSLGICYGNQVVFSTNIDGQPCPNMPTFTDIDGNIYNTVTIGYQCWMKENLRVTHYADNTEIPIGSTSNTTYSSDPYRWAPLNDESNVAMYGYLYNWTAVMHSSSSSNAVPSGVQGICPTGWHVPSNAEWARLTDYVSSQSQWVCNGNSTYIAKALAGLTGWDSSGTSCSVGKEPSENNATEFSALPAGLLSNGAYNSYTFSNFGRTAKFWSCTKNESDANYAYDRGLGYSSLTVKETMSTRGNGYSVRCVKD